jgi:hypothetical protein
VDRRGGSEATVRIAKTDLIPTSANLREKYGSFAELRGACAIFCWQVGGCVPEVARLAASPKKRGPGGSLFGSGGNHYCNGACPSPRRTAT